MTQHDDRLYLGQMLDAAREAAGYIVGIDLDAFSEDRMRQRAVVYVIQMIGESARRVSPSTRTHLSEIPWPQVVGMRNRLVHDYLHVDYEEVWRTAKEDLPSLIETLEEALSD
jgi:uncharacterized protein with HEPN domain